MPAEISIDSYPANDFGSLKGKVESIGSDVIENDNSPNQTELFFPASIFLENQNLVLKMEISFLTSWNDTSSKYKTSQS